MERLTEKHADINYVKVVAHGKTIDKLAAYEDTGLEPVEVAQLIKDTKVFNTDNSLTEFGQALAEARGAIENEAYLEERIAVLELALQLACSTEEDVKHFIKMAEKRIKE